MLMTFGRTLLLLATLALSLAASAQHPLAGAWQETQIGFLVTFEQQPNGQLTGTLQGQAGPMPLNIVSDQQNAQGTFLLEGQVAGFAAQLQPDNNTLLIWLFDVDAAGQAIPNTYEQYQAFRAKTPAVTPPPPPFGAIPVVPGGGNLPQPPPATNPFGLPPTGSAPIQPTTPMQPVTPAVQQGDIAGTWRTDGQFDNGTPFTVDLKFDANGAWQMDILVEGQPFGYVGGSYTFTQDGMLQYQETIRSPQVCFQGECQENSLPDSSGNDQVHFQDANTIVTVDVESGEQTVYTRVVEVSQPQVPGFGVPAVTQPMVPPVAGNFPQAPTVTPPGPRDPTTAPMLASDFIGVWQTEQNINENVTITISSTFRPDGSWRNDFTHQGSPMAFYEGTFTVSPEGILQLQVNNRSPQLCLLNTCEPTTEADIIRTFQITFHAVDTFDMLGTNSGGEKVQLTYRKSGSGF